jgi:hypothetical protein
MSGASASQALRAAALAALLLGILLLLGSWDGLYSALDLPQALPALFPQLGGAAFVALAYLLWAAGSRPELAPAAAGAGLIVEGGSAVIIAAWLIFRDPSEDLGIDTLGTTLLVVAAAVLAVLALALARIALGEVGRAE